MQVSLYANEDTDQHYRVGQALEGLRDEGVLIIGAGMAVHNLRDYRAIRGTSNTMPSVHDSRKILGRSAIAKPPLRYAYTFDEALREAATAKPEERQAKMLELMRRKDARDAHPSLEHILPIHVSAGAGGADVGKRIWTLPEKSLSWAQYRFGDIPVA